jgi:putative ABC transport system permease protein
VKPFRTIWLKLRSLGQLRTVKQEIDEELRFHIEQRMAENIAAGMSPEDAAREARKRFGNLQTVREQCRERRGANFGEVIFQDVRFALRMLRKNPGFTSVAVLTLALGIGGNTAIFSVVNAVLLKPLPYREPNRIVMLWTDNPSLNLGFHELPPTPPDLIEWRAQANSFEQIAGIRPSTADLSEQGDPERLGGAQVTANFFALLGAQPSLGRLFSPEEAKPGQDKVAVISYGLWERHFGADPNVIGKTIVVNREHRTVLGVMPAGFNFPRGAEMPAMYGLAPHTDVWLPFAERAEYWANNDTRDFIAIGRFRPEVSLVQAQAEMTGLAERKAKDHALTHAGWIVHLRPLALQITGKARPILLALMGSVGFVLMIACVNVSNLLLCRSAARRQEMAVRAAVGAGRARLIRQLLSESAVLSMLGGGLGLLLGAWGVRLILALSPPNIPRLSETGLDLRVFGFALIVSLATGVVFGLAPAWQASKINLTQALKGGARSGGRPGSHRSLNLLVIAEVALASVLLTGAGLMAQSFLRLQAVDPGFHPQQVTAFDVSLFGDKYNGQSRTGQFFRDARERLAKLPGMHSAGAISSLPLSGSENLSHLSIEGARLDGREEPITEDRRITPGYFETMGVSLFRGRDFSDLDGAQQERVCIINQSIARQLFPGGDPIDKRLKLGRNSDKAPWLTIVGIVADVRGFALEVEPKPQVYSPLDQDTQNEVTFVVRADLAPAASVERAIRAEMKSLDPALPPANFRAMESLVGNAVARPRFSAVLLGLFAITALVLTAIGLYGVVAYSTAQRSREIGIRMALGASRQNVLALVIRQGMWPSLLGLAIGMAGALALTRLLTNQLYEVKATDPMTFFSVAAILLLVTLTACCLPARRATRIDPMTALRCE